eukprot:3609528-Rhodomonas_salina.1
MQDRRKAAPKQAGRVEEGGGLSEVKAVEEEEDREEAGAGQSDCKLETDAQPNNAGTMGGKSEEGGKEEEQRGKEEAEQAEAAVKIQAG